MNREAMTRVRAWLLALPELHPSDASYWTNGAFANDCRDAADCIAESLADRATALRTAGAVREPLTLNQRIRLLEGNGFSVGDYAHRLILVVEAAHGILARTQPATGATE